MLDVFFDASRNETLIFNNSLTMSDFVDKLSYNNINNNNNKSLSKPSLVSYYINISFCIVILVFAVISNVAVIITLSLNRALRTVQNIFLINLAISDIGFTLVCIPPKLVSIMYGRYMFDKHTCKALIYLQGM